GITAASFRFEKFAPRFAADLFVGCPEEDEAFAERRFALLKRLQREERLNDSGFHVEGAWAISFAAGNAEGHLSQRAAGIDGVVMAEDQQLARSTIFSRCVSDAENI